MKVRKSWIKRLIITAGIIAFVGVGIGFATERMDRSDHDHGKQGSQLLVSVRDGEGRDEAGDHHERGMDRGEHEHEGWGAALAIGGTLVGAGLLYGIIRSRKRASGLGAGSAVSVIPSTSDFLDQWEKNQTNTKESN
ncbi:hypothetical protein [Gorillibacterium timonense]|uniref:hypothetical protein n=1 Tax=Gorillibacterium timonense TaxID=1689269 RepID=UPI00071C655F|nr:hypothetical protein [Gorillibacterium timonense]